MGSQSRYLSFSAADQMRSNAQDVNEAEKMETSLKPELSEIVF
jgi:hypothetical protein